MGKKKEAEPRSKATTLITAIVAIILGIVLLMNPTGVALALTYVVGIVLIVLGVVKLIGYIRAGDSGSQVDFIVSIVEIVVGAIVCIWPDVFVNWLVVIVGVLIVVMAVGDIADARTASKLGAPFATGKLVLAVISLVIGVVVIISPFAFVDLAFTIAGIALIVYGVSEFIAALKS